MFFFYHWRPQCSPTIKLNTSCGAPVSWCPTTGAPRDWWATKAGDLVGTQSPGAHQETGAPVSWCPTTRFRFISGGNMLNSGV